MSTNCKKKEKTEGKIQHYTDVGSRRSYTAGTEFMSVSDKPDPGTPHVVDTRETPKKTAINKNNKNNTLRIIIICKKKSLHYI